MTGLPLPGLDGRDASPPVDLIVLAGGRGSRLGGANKPAVTVAGRTLLSRVLDVRGLVRHAVVVGPDSARPAAGSDAVDLVWTLEEPPFGGPVAGIVTGLAALEHRAGPHPAAWVLLLACDLPWATNAAGLLIGAVTDPELPGAVDGVHLVDESDRPQWLAGIYRENALRVAARRMGTAARGASVQGLLGGLTLRGIRDTTGAGRDVDTWQDVSRSTALLNPTRRNTQ